MNYIYDVSLLGEDYVLFLENFEQNFLIFVRQELKNFPSLGVNMKWNVEEYHEKFLHIVSNASFDIAESLALESKLESYLSKKLKVTISNVSLVLHITYAQKEVPPCSSSSQTGKVTDDLPTFLPQTPRYTFDQLILPEETRQRIFNDLNTIRHQDLIYHTWGFEEVDAKPKSILNFFGPPGTGKTMCAHAIAHFMQKPLLALNYSEIESKYVGDAAKNLKKAFDTATELGAIMFFDEADSFLGKRIENVSHGSDQALNSLRSQMLILLEEFEGVVLFATNLVTNFDKAFESRILDHIKFELPNREARADIIAKMIPSRLPLERPLTVVDYLEASDLIAGFAGREIKSAILTMLLNKAGLEEAEPVFTFEDIKTALVEKKTQIEKLQEEEKERRKAKIIKRLEEKFEEDAAAEQHKKNYRNKPIKFHKRR